ncbi:MAG: CPBP family intramembrane metalloprotease [Lachnospiraceae bacterium]|nr:CPBP family intramembrane metalloprotease [Lachnospiraceae bacterium]
MLRIKPIKIRVALLAVLVEICLMPLMGLCNLITETFTPNVVEVSLSKTIAETPYLLMIFSMCLVPAILEEMLSRGLYLSAFLRTGRTLHAIFFAALCFALAHGNINQFAYALIAGVVMGLVVEATDSVITGMVIHFVTNALSVTIMYATYYANIAYEQTKELFGTDESLQVAGFLEDTELMKSVEVMTRVIVGIIFVGLAILGVMGIYRLIGRMAIISGRYEHMKSFMPEYGIFRMRNRFVEMMERSGSNKSEIKAVADLPCTRIMNPILALGMLIWVVDMVVYELIVHGGIIIK